MKSYAEFRRELIVARFMLYLPLISNPEVVADDTLKRLGWQLDIERYVAKNSNLGYSVYFKLEQDDIRFGIFQIEFRDFIDKIADILGVKKPEEGWTEIAFHPNYIKNGRTNDIFIFQFVGVILDMYDCDLMLAEQNLNTPLMNRSDDQVKIFEVYSWEEEHIDAIGVPVEYSK